MKRVFIGLGIVAALAAGLVAILAARYVPTTPAGTTVGTVAIGSSSKEKVATLLREYWAKQLDEPIVLSLENSGDTYVGSVAKLGIDLDLEGTIGQIGFESFWDSLTASLAGNRKSTAYDLKFQKGKPDLADLERFVAARVPERSPARAIFRDGVITTTPERAGFKLDPERAFEAALLAYQRGETGKIPIIEGPKKVADDALASITDVVSTFTTRFSEGKVSRSHNIRNAAGRIDGVVLAPGETFSFNKVVGRRTIEAGFMTAGVYKNGKHDVDIGGGICQVSTTLYNAAIFANLKIDRRSNHSMPVPYVPLGRDATVDYGSADLVLRNGFDTPIAISSSVGKGSITFRVLGKADPSLSVKVISGAAKSWEVGEKSMPDPGLPAGKTKIIEKGSRGHSISTFRVVYRDGVEIKREPLGMSFYRGAKRIIAVGGGGTPQTSSSPLDSTPPAETVGAGG